MAAGLGRLGRAVALMLALILPSQAQTPVPGAPGEVDVFIAGAASDRVDILLHFLSAGIDPDSIGRDGTTALVAAARAGAEGALKLLLARGADPDLANEEGWTALMEACYRDRAGLVKLLIGAGAKVDPVESRHGKTALMVAAEGKEIDSLVALLDAGAAIDARSADGRTGLMRAAMNRSEEAVAMMTELVVRGADADLADGDGSTALLLAAETGEIKRLGLLLEAGADADAVAKDGRSALGVAARHGFTDLVAYLLARGAKAANVLALAPLAEAALSGDRAIVAQLIEAGAEIDAAGQSGRTALMIASRDGRDELVDLLLERGAAVNAVNAVDGTTALMWAANSGWISVVRRLLDAGARVSVVAKDGWTAVEAARMAGHADIVRVLEEAM